MWPFRLFRRERRTPANPDTPFNVRRFKQKVACTKHPEELNKLVSSIHRQYPALVLGGVNSVEVKVKVMILRSVQLQVFDLSQRLLDWLHGIKLYSSRARSYILHWLGQSRDVVSWTERQSNVLTVSNKVIRRIDEQLQDLLVRHECSFGYGIDINQFGTAWYIIEVIVKSFIARPLARTNPSIKRKLRDDVDTMQTYLIAPWIGYCERALNDSEQDSSERYRKIQRKEAPQAVRTSHERRSAPASRRSRPSSATGPPPPPPPPPPPQSRAAPVVANRHLSQSSSAHHSDAAAFSSSSDSSSSESDVSDGTDVHTSPGTTPPPRGSNLDKAPAQNQTRPSSTATIPDRQSSAAVNKKTNGKNRHIRWADIEGQDYIAFSRAVVDANAAVQLSTYNARERAQIMLRINYYASSHYETVSRQVFESINIAREHNRQDIMRRNPSASQMVRLVDMLLVLVRNCAAIRESKEREPEWDSYTAQLAAEERDLKTLLNAVKRVVLGMVASAMNTRGGSPAYDATSVLQLSGEMRKFCREGLQRAKRSSRDLGQTHSAAVVSVIAAPIADSPNPAGLANQEYIKFLATIRLVDAQWEGLQEYLDRIQDSRRQISTHPDHMTGSISDLAIQKDHIISRRIRHSHKILLRTATNFALAFECLRRYSTLLQSGEASNRYSNEEVTLIKTTLADAIRGIPLPAPLKIKQKLHESLNPLRAQNSEESPRFLQQCCYKVEGMLNHWLSDVYESVKGYATGNETAQGETLQILKKVREQGQFLHKAHPQEPTSTT